MSAKIIDVRHYTRCFIQVTLLYRYS